MPVLPKVHLNKQVIKILPPIMIGVPFIINYKRNNDFFKKLIKNGVERHGTKITVAENKELNEHYSNPFPVLEVDPEKYSNYLNVIREEFLNLNIEWLFLLDNNLILSENTLTRIMFICLNHGISTLAVECQNGFYSPSKEIGTQISNKLHLSATMLHRSLIELFLFEGKTKEETEANFAKKCSEINILLCYEPSISLAKTK